ncbi:MAG: methionine--tRNA ligase [Phycisphaerales bacterium]|nr:methionine--tRNA ligase [Phycisphaerales bacterium]
MPSDTTNQTPYYVTTPIYYVNDRPHIGHCYTTLIADVAARAQRLVGRDVFFLTGTDEHAEKVSKTAAENAKTPYEWATINAERFRDAFRFMNFSNDDFVRTTEDRHKDKASAYIEQLLDQGDIELGDYEGWYDPSQEEYLTEIVAKENDYKSPVTGKPLEKRVEQNYFFRLDKYQDWLEQQITSGEISVLPEARKNEVLGRLKQGLMKVPVSRRIKEGDADWGIRMPGDDAHRIYVWIEALCNYLTIVDTDERKKYWDGEVVHLMAKDIIWFHAIIWPAMLHALGKEPPRTVYAHAYWIAEGTKMSKSLGNFIEIDLLRAYAEKYSLDAVRWFLTTQGPLGANDADFAHSRFIEVYNADLANSVGNSMSRVGNMVHKYYNGIIPGTCNGEFGFPNGSSLQTALKALENAGKAVDDPTRTFRFAEFTSNATDNALRALETVDLESMLDSGRSIVRHVDEFISYCAPFTLAKQLDALDDGDHALTSILYSCAEALRIASLLLSPAMPEKMAELWRNWSCSHLADPNNANSGFVAPLAELARWGGEYSIKKGQQIAKGDALFMRADASEPAPEPAPEPERIG